MKNIGITRKLDELGRITLPIELRRNMNIKEGDPLEIYTESGRIILETFKEQCVGCGGADDLREFTVNDGIKATKKYICTCCAQTINKMAKGLSDDGCSVEF